MTRLIGAPDRSHEAKRGVILRRLVMDEWLDELDAEDRVAAWERLAGELGRDRGSIGYWDEGWRWITTTHPRAALATP
jgi:hypothetical protein